MKAFVDILLVFGPLLLFFGAMPLLWRRMKRVREQAYRNAESDRPEPHWQETVDTRDGLTIARDQQPNEELIKLGDRATHSRWPISDP